MASAFDRHEPVALLDLLRRGFEVVDGDQDVVELDQRSAFFQIGGTVRG